MTETMDVTMGVVTTMESVPAEVLVGKVPTGELVVELLARADAEGLSLVEPGALLAGLAETVLETARVAEMTERLGYGAYDRPIAPLGQFAQRAPQPDGAHRRRPGLPWEYARAWGCHEIVMPASSG